MARAYPLTDLVKLVRAYGVLTGTSDRERVIAGRLSKRWIATEVEHFVPLNSLPPPLFRTARGRDLLAAELFARQDIDPESIDVDSLDIDALGANRWINTNRLPKLEPIINAAVLTANILLGVRLYGNHGNGMPIITHDLIVAAMLQDTLGKNCQYSPITVGDHEMIDEAYIFSWFGDSVANDVHVLAEYLAAFEAAVGARVDPPPAPSKAMATAVAAIQASRLRLTARAAGDQVISFLDEAGREELTALGIDVNSDFPELPYLVRDYERTVAAFALSGVDHYALREPLRNTLLMAVRDTLDDPKKRERLSGRRGKAVHEVHMNLPVMEYFVVAEAPNSIETVHIASLEMMRSLEKGRRKSLSTMSGHAFRISAIAERTLGRALEPLIVTLAMLHDVVEDGSLRVTGYGHSLRKIQFRFGGPIAAMVSELTDSHVNTAGALKARLTLKQPHLLLPQAQYNVDRYTEMQPTPTRAEEPYTLAGIVIKLLDTVVSLEEGIRHPELMSSYWRYSGARIYWIERVRGAIVTPLLERLLIETRASRLPTYSTRPHHVNTVRLRAGLALLETVMAYQDLYATQNLAILAREYQLDVFERQLLIDLFFDANLDPERFRALVLDELLDDRRLVDSVAKGLLPVLGFSALYTKGSKQGSPRDESTFLRYRKNCLRRKKIRMELGIDSAEKTANLEVRKKRMLRQFDRTMTKVGVFDETLLADGESFGRVAGSSRAVPKVAPVPADEPVVEAGSTRDAGSAGLPASGAETSAGSGTVIGSGKAGASGIKAEPQADNLIDDASSPRARAG